MRMAWVMVLGACSGSGGGDEVTGDAPAACTHAPHVRAFRARVQTFGTQLGAVYEGMICVDGRGDLGCTFADATKTFELCIPHGDFGLRFTQRGFETTIYLLGPEATPPGAPFTVPDLAYSGAKIWGPIGGVSPQTTNGNVVVLVMTLAKTPLANAQVALAVPGVYADDGSLPDPALTATTTSGAYYATNVPPGPYDVRVSAAGACRSSSGGFASPDATQTIRVTAVAGATVVASVACGT